MTMCDIRSNSILNSKLSSGKNDFLLNQSLALGNYIIVISGNGEKEFRKLTIK